MTESSHEIIDSNRFEVNLGASNQAEIFEAIAKHIHNRGDTVETLELSTGSERFQAKVVFYTEDISMCQASLR